MQENDTHLMRLTPNHKITERAAFSPQIDGFDVSFTQQTHLMSPTFNMRLVQASNMA